jgi:DNA-binding NarL/FixJ family response regulator
MNAPRIGIVASKQMKAFAKFLDLEAVISLEDSSASILRITEALISRKKAESKSRSNTDFYDTATIPIRLEALTKTEQNFFEHLTKGRSIKEISYKMGISQKTANNHRDAIKRKMGIATSRELELLAFTFGFQIREHHS